MFGLLSGGAEVFWGDKAVQRLSELIEGARKQLVLVSPYVNLDEYRNLLRPLREALERGVQVRLVVRKQDSSTRQNVASSPAINELRDLGLKLTEVADLHAKVYLSENAALITSLNLLESSLRNSIEIGVKVEQGSKQYTQVEDFLRWLDTNEEEAAARNVSVRSSETRQTKDTRRSPKRSAASSGFCIRCERNIALNPERPLCGECYDSWREYSNARYREKFCHDCGNEASTSFAKPLCKDCYELQAA